VDGIPAVHRHSYEHRLSVVTCAALAGLLLCPDALLAQTTESPAFLRLETKIPLGQVRGRIDHMAIDVKRQRLFVAELGSDRVGVVDLKEGKTVTTIRGLAEPQGVGYVPSNDTLYVANARDGSVRLFRGADYTPVGRIDLGDDADNVRVDVAANRVLVGHGNGAIAAIDVAQQTKFGDVALPAHPESFQITTEPDKVFVNVPGAHAIAVLNGLTGSQMAIWPTREDGNFPMALDKSNGRVLTVSRSPPRLNVRSAEDGTLIASAETCSDSDDLFVDDKRGRIYVSCGAGAIDVFDWEGTRYNRAGRVSTLAGARTSLFVPELDVLLLGVRTSATEAAAVWVFKPLP
jgi:DNA-binding beta-propeller fold protein YncE